MPKKDERVRSLIKPKLAHSLIFVFIYTIITVILTYPVAFKIGTHIPGHIDAFQWMRTLWYTRYAIDNPANTTLWHDSLSFYPSGIDTIAFPSFFNQMISVLLLSFLDIQVIYTIVWLLSFIIGSYGAFLLADYLTENKRASFIAGIIFAFNPYHLVHGMGHLGAITMQWIPFSALYLMKCFREPSTKNSILAGVFFVMVAFSDLQYMIFMGIFAALLFFYDLYLAFKDNAQTRADRLLKTIKGYAIFGLVAFLGILPLTINEITIATSTENFLKPDLSEATTLSTDLISFFLPSIFHPIFGEIVAPIRNSFTGNYSENTTFIGFVVLALSIIAFLWLRSDRTAKFWIISAIFFSVMSLGPVLHLFGQTEFTSYRLTIPLPYSILYDIVPFLDNCRTVGRLFAIAVLSFSVLAAYGMSWLMRRYSWGSLAAISIACLIIFEYLCVPYTLSYVDQPSFYKNISDDKCGYALLEIPATKSYGMGTMILYYQTIHKKPIVGSQAARIQSTSRDFEFNTPFIRELTFLTSVNDIIDQNATEIGASVLNHYNIKYVILHLIDPESQFADPLLSSALKTEPAIYENGSLKVYEVPALPMQPFMAWIRGFYDIEDWSGTPTRWMQPDAAVLAYSTDNCTANLSLQAMSFLHPRTVKIYSGEKLIACCITNSSSFANVTAVVPLTKGDNIIRFHVPEGYDRPADISGANNPDDRHLSVAVQNIRLKIIGLKLKDSNPSDFLPTPKRS